MMRSVVLLAVFLCAGQASAELLKESYTEKVLSWSGKLNAIGAANKLTETQLDTARKTASGWLFLGPCEGRYIDLRSHPAGYAIDVMNNPDFNNNLHASILQMVAVLTSENLGRKPSNDMCRFAEDLSSAH